VRQSRERGTKARLLYAAVYAAAKYMAISWAADIFFSKAAVWTMFAHASNKHQKEQWLLIFTMEDF